MNLGLGIDTGGTFTDAVIMDLDTKEVLVKAKSPTTYQDLSIGIMGAIDNSLALQAVDVKDIKMVGLSTTLATNSILEGRGGEVGLIGIGWKPDADWKFPCKLSHFVKGGYDSMGAMSEPLDEEEVQKVIEEMCPHVDSVVVSGKFSVANPIQESTVRGMITSQYDIPVV
ncbi:MAG: hydantoinase/oxoprolinase family protein, partial [Euryarchaeota archaeon]|nr:hydantoinase/oxoprolinase family protein [Euryarchaeota archaeon]